MAQKNQYIESAYERLQVINQDKEKRLEYDAREKAILNHNQMMLEAEKRENERLSKLFGLLVQDKRYDDLERAAGDDDFLQRLMLDYDI